MTTDRFVMIDGHALAYRMFFALPLESFTTKSGEPTNATYGFTRTLLDHILADEPPDYLAVSFDLGATFRDDLYADYKGTRDKMPDELDVQITRIKEVVRALNIPILECEGFEADDVLGTIARQMNGRVPVYIITGDRDLLQLVDDNTRVELPPRRAGDSAEVYDAAGVVGRLGVRPDQVVDFKALVGDVSDNIPGVRASATRRPSSCWPSTVHWKTSTPIWMTSRAHCARSWRDGRESADLSYQLARIVTDAPVTVKLEDCHTRDFDINNVIALFRELEFRGMTNALVAKLGAPETPITVTAEGEAWRPTEVVVVRDEAALADLATRLAAAQWISFDVETDSLERLLAGVVGICLAIEPPVAYYIPIGHVTGAAQVDSGQMNLFAGEAQPAPDQLPLARVVEVIGPALRDPAIPKGGPQCQVRLHDPQPPRPAGVAGGLRHDDRRVADRPGDKAQGAEGPGPPPAGGGDDRHRSAHRPRQDADDLRPSADRDRRPLWRGRRRHDAAPAAAAAA
jgi:DNA polymerase-1